MSLTSFAKSGLDTALNITFPMWRHKRDCRLILCYHRVYSSRQTPVFENPVTCISETAFARQMSWIKTFAHITTLDDLVLGPDAGAANAWRVAVTFDDGYLDTFDVALPILASMGIPATVFVATDFCEYPERIPWWDVASVVARQRTGRIEIRRADLPDGCAARMQSASENTPVDLACDSTRRWLLDSLSQSGRSTGYSRLAASVARQLSQHGACPVHNAFARPETIAAAARTSDVTIGVHTATHPVLAALSEAEQRREITHARQSLAAWHVPAAPWFAYPFGHPASYSDTTIAVLRDLGFQGAVTTTSSTVTPAHNRYSLPRLDVDGRWSDHRFRARVGAAALALGS